MQRCECEKREIENEGKTDATVVFRNHMSCFFKSFGALERVWRPTIFDNVGSHVWHCVSAFKICKLQCLGLGFDLGLG